MSRATSGKVTRWPFCRCDSKTAAIISTVVRPSRALHNGGRDPAYREEDGARVMKPAEIDIHVALGRGSAEQTVWTCDFSYEYVKINAEYRT